MKRLVLTFAILANFAFGGVAQNVWKTIGMDGEFLGVSANGNMFTNMGYSGMFRSQDEGETWEHIDVASYVRKETFMINEQDRIFVFNENTHKLCYSDDNGDTWQEQTSGISTNWPLGMFSLSNDTIFICSREKFHWTLDGGESWDETPIDFIGEANFGSILADHTGNVYVSTYSWTYPVEQVGIYTATLDDMTNWTVKSLGGASQMAFDSEGYILATSLGSAYFENGIYWVNADRFALTDDDIIFAMKRVDWDNEALFYSTDHGQTYTQCSENIPSTTTAPDPDLGLFIGRDTHLYCHGDVWEPTFVSQYYKSIQNADEITGDSPTLYHPIVEDGKQWNVLFSYPWSPPEPQHKYTDIYKIEGDTLVDGVSYKVMYATRNENLTGWNLWGFLRETEDGQVFSRRPSTSDEQLLYDFSMEVGDSICMCDFGYYECCMVVIEKGEILVNGEPRQQIVLEYPWGNGEGEVWIEGIGSLYGIVNSGALFLMGGSTDLLCYYEDGDLIWQNTTPGYNECYIVNPSQHGDLVISPGVLTFEEPFVPQTFTISNQTDEAITISAINVEPDDFMVLVYYSNLPRTLQPNESMDVEVELNGIGYKGYNNYYVNIATSIGNRQVIVRVNEEAWDEGLLWMPMQGITFDGNTPLTQSFYLYNTNALQSITVYEISEYGTNYLEMVPAHSMPYEIPAGGFLEVAVTLVNFPEEQTVTQAYCRSSEGEGAGYFFFIAGGLSNGGNGVHSLWKLINLPGTLLGANAQGYMFSTNYENPQSLMRSHDDGETWETVLTGSIGNLTISNEGRIFVFSHNTMTVMYSDDNGDTWQQTNQISPCGMIDTPRLCATTNDIIVVWAQNGEIDYTLDGGDTWNGTILDFMEEHQEISDLLVSENGDVYVSVWYYIGPNIGVYHSTLSDMQNWEIAAFEDVGIKDMAFDPEGNIVCAVNFGGDFSGFEHVPGFYAFWANRVGIADNGIVYKTAMTMYDNAVLAYSLDHGEHFYNTIENLPLSEPIPGGEDGFLSKGYDNHLYFLGNGQYWKSIPNANDIPNVISFPSEWYYEIENENGTITYQYMYQAGDTVVGDEPSHILVKINTLYDKELRDEVTREYVYMRDGKVYWWNKTLEEFTVLYDFGAQEGDTWVTKVGTETLIMHVNSVETVEYEDKTYRMLHVSDVDNYFSGDIVCGIGHLTSFFPERLMDNSNRMRVEGLRCYWIEDELVFKLGDEDCDAVISDLHGLEESAENQFDVYPNPTNGVLFVETCYGASLPAETYRITNLTGQTLLQGQITTETQQIDVSGLPNGMYFISIGSETRKFVVR